MSHMHSEDKRKLTRSLEGRFLYQEYHFDLTPPPPYDGATIIKPTIDVEALTNHKVFSSNIAALTSFLIPADFKLSPEDLVLLASDFGSQKGREEMAEEDAEILREKAMWAKKA